MANSQNQNGTAAAKSAAPKSGATAPRRRVSMAEDREAQILRLLEQGQNRKALRLAYGDAFGPEVG
jgi:hypothetical protein